MRATLRIGTRGSPLALAQTELVLAALRRSDPHLRSETVLVRTAGDRNQRANTVLDFTDEIDRRLERGLIDCAVHSAKDLPARPTREIRVGAYLPRADPRDCLVLRNHGTLRSLTPGARIGSSSLRRQAQLTTVRPDLEVVPIRGNIGTRLEKMASLRLDGVMLAAAGLIRLGWIDRISQYLSGDRWLPSPCQGAIAVEIRDGDRHASDSLASIDHLPTRQAVESERAVVAALGGDCNLPLGSLARLNRGQLHLRAALYSQEGRRPVLLERTAKPADAVRAGQGLGIELAGRGQSEGYRW